MKAVRERTDHVSPEAAPAPSRLARLTDRLFARVDIASIVFFRIGFGTLMLWEMIRYLTKGWIGPMYVSPTFHFTYYGFDWVRPLPGAGMTLVFVGLGVLAIMIALGYKYRVATTLFFLGFSYVFLLEQARYLNHFYLIILFSFLLIFIPANRAFSLDARNNPELESSTAPAWALWVLMIQMGVAYFFSGLAKINPDWLAGEPLRGWLANATDFPIIGGLFTQEWLVYGFAYGSLFLDLLAFPLLLWRRTRLVTFGLLIVFHVMNAIWLQIGIFPWLAIAATAMFFPPEWPRRVFARPLAWARKRQRQRPKRRPVGRRQVAAPPKALVSRKVAVTLMGVWLAFQVLFPLRHFLYPGEVSWTEEGHHFAWHMMLRDKEGAVRFYVTRPDSGHTFEVDPGNYLTIWQLHPMNTRPYLILQFAHHLADTFSPPQGPQVEVRAHAVAVMNFGEPQLLVDPRVDLAKEEVGLGAADWIVPLGSDLEFTPPEL